MGTEPKLQLEVITPGGVVLREEVEYVEAPGVLGYVGILPGHAPFLTRIRSGRLEYRLDGEDHVLAVHWGYLEVLDDDVVVLAETAERPDDIELQRADDALRRARERQEEFGAAYDPLRAERAAERARTRIDVVRAQSGTGADDPPGATRN